MIAISNLVGSSARLIAVSHVRQERFTKVLLPKHYDVCTLGSRRSASGFRPRGCRVPDGVSHLKCEQRRSTNSRDSAGAVFRGEVGADNATFGRTLPSTADQAKVSPPRIAAPSATARRIERVLWSGRRKSSMSVPTWSITLAQRSSLRQMARKACALLLRGKRSSDSVSRNPARRRDFMIV